MIASLNIRALAIGAVVLVGGYFVCAAFMLAVGSIGVTHSLPLLFALMAPFLLASTVSGFLGALFAPEKPLLHGTLGAAFGALLLFTFTLLCMLAFHLSAGLEQALPFLIMVAPAFGGALFAVHVWPRHGL